MRGVRLTGRLTTSLAAVALGVGGLLLPGCGHDGSESTPTADPRRLDRVEAAIVAAGQPCTDTPTPPDEESRSDFRAQGLTPPTLRLTCGPFELYDFPDAEARQAHADLVTALMCSIGGAPVARVTYLGDETWDAMHAKGVEPASKGGAADGVGILTRVGKKLGVEPTTVECVVGAGG